MVFRCINIRQVPKEVLKTKAFGLGLQHLPQDLANVNAWKNMFDPYIANVLPHRQICSILLFVNKRTNESDWRKGTICSCVAQEFLRILGRAACKLPAF